MKTNPFALLAAELREQISTCVPYSGENLANHQKMVGEVSEHLIDAVRTLVISLPYISPLANKCAEQMKVLAGALHDWSEAGLAQALGIGDGRRIDPPTD